MRYAFGGADEPIRPDCVNCRTYDDDNQHDVDGHRAIGDRRPSHRNGWDLALFHRAGLSRIEHEKSVIFTLVLESSTRFGASQDNAEGVLLRFATSARSSW